MTALPPPCFLIGCCFRSGGSFGYANRGAIKDPPRGTANQKACVFPIWAPFQNQGSAVVMVVMIQRIWKHCLVHLHLLMRWRPTLIDHGSQQNTVPPRRWKRYLVPLLMLPAFGDVTWPHLTTMAKRPQRKKRRSSFHQCLGGRGCTLSLTPRQGQLCLGIRMVMVMAVQSGWLATMACHQHGHASPRIVSLSRSWTGRSWTGRTS